MSALDGHYSQGAVGGAAFNTSGSPQTTSGNLIVLGIADNQGTSSITDSAGNSYTALNDYTIIQRAKLYYCLNPTVGSGHYWTLSGAGAASFFAAWFSGVNAYDLQSGRAAAGAASITLSSAVTPSENGSLLVTVLNADVATTMSIDAGFTITDQIAGSGGNHVGGAFGYLIQSTAAAVNPTWSWTGTTNPNMGLASFTPSGGGGGGRTTKNTRNGPLGLAHGINRRVHVG